MGTFFILTKNYQGYLISHYLKNYQAWITKEMTNISSSCTCLPSSNVDSFSNYITCTDLVTLNSHCIFTKMNHQRISTFQFCSRQEPKLKRIFEILWVLFEKISVFYSDLPKSWIWRSLGHVRNIFCTCHLHISSQKSFRQKKFEFHARVQKCHSFFL